MRSSLILRAGAALAALLLATTATATQLDMTPGVTEISQEVFKLHRFMLYICIAIGVAAIVAAALGAAVFRRLPAGDRFA